MGHVVGTTMTEIRPTTLYRQLDAAGPDPYVLDVRPPDAFEEWHIPGSHNIDVFDELEDDPDAAAAKLADVPEDRPIVTVCAAGVRSREATALLRRRGHEARTLVDGMNGWSRVHTHAVVDVDLPGTLVQVARPGKGCLSHVLVSDGLAAVFDPSHDGAAYEAILEEHRATLVGVFDTHAHADHVSGGPQLADRHEVPYHLHPADAAAVDAAALDDGQRIDVGDVAVEVVHTPGHSPGGVTFDVAGEALLTGDTLFHESVGRVELGVEAGLEETDVAANAETLYESLERLARIDGNPVVLPAHDPGAPEPPVTKRLASVLEENPDLHRDRAAFIEILAEDLPDHPPNFERVKRINVGEEELADEDPTAIEVGPNRCAAQ